MVYVERFHSANSERVSRVFQMIRAPAGFRSRVVGSVPSKARGLLAISCAALLVMLAVACGPSPRPIVFVSDRDGNLEIYSVDPSGESLRNLTSSPTDESVPVLSPNRELIAFQSYSGSDSALEVMQVDGTSRTALAGGTGVHRSQRWSPQSDRIAYIAEQGGKLQVFVVNTDGSNMLLLTAIAGDEVGDWSQSGTAVVFAVHDGEDMGIYTRNPDGVNEFRVSEAPDFHPIWAPNSRRLAFLSTRDGSPDIYVMDADGSDQKRVTQTDEPEYDVSWSPNGKKLLFVSERDGNPEIYIADADGRNQIRLTFNNASDVQPVWSPNGKKIAFVSDLDGDAEIVVMDIDGKNQVRVTINDAQDTNPSW